MSFIGCGVDLYNAETDLAARLATARFRNFVRFIPIAMAAITVAGCNQYAVATNKSDFHKASRRAVAEYGEPTVGTVRHVAVRRIKHTPFKRPVQTQFASHGVASFYSDIDCGAPQPAIRHALARDQRRYRPLRDGAHKRPRPLCAWPHCRCFIFCRGILGNCGKGDSEGQS